MIAGNYDYTIWELSKAVQKTLGSVTNRISFAEAGSKPRRFSGMLLGVGRSSLRREHFIIRRSVVKCKSSEGGHRKVKLLNTQFTAA